jgi:hypothetical protein
MLWLAQEESPLTPRAAMRTSSESVEGEEASEHVDSADLAADHLILRLAVMFSRMALAVG